MSMCYDCPQLDANRNSTPLRAVCCLDQPRDLRANVELEEARAREQARSQASSEPRNRHERRRAAKVAR